MAITTVRLMKRVFSLSLRALQGFVDSIFKLMNLSMCCPDYSLVSRRAKTVNKVRFIQQSRRNDQCWSFSRSSEESL
ncbi:transposase [Salmonella enterica subsp. enterica serovar Enteritidis str. SARB17]|nr:transposase [Salmonella enterica subsp. enterica serovar Enteritidis str. SARB17]